MIYKKNKLSVYRNGGVRRLQPGGKDDLGASSQKARATYGSTLKDLMKNSSTQTISDRLDELKSKGYSVSSQDTGWIMNVTPKAIKGLSVDLCYVFNKSSNSFTEGECGKQGMQTGAQIRALYNSVLQREIVFIATKETQSSSTSVINDNISFGKRGAPDPRTRLSDAGKRAIASGCDCSKGTKEEILNMVEFVSLYNKFMSKPKGFAATIIRKARNEMDTKLRAVEVKYGRTFSVDNIVVKYPKQFNSLDEAVYWKDQGIPYGCICKVEGSQPITIPTTQEIENKLIEEMKVTGIVGTEDKPIIPPTKTPKVKPDSVKPWVLTEVRLTRPGIAQSNNKPHVNAKPQEVQTVSFRVDFDEDINYIGISKYRYGSLAGDDLRMSGKDTAIRMKDLLVTIPLTFKDVKKALEDMGKSDDYIVNFFNSKLDRNTYRFFTRDFLTELKQPERILANLDSKFNVDLDYLTGLAVIASKGEQQALIKKIFDTKFNAPGSTLKKDIIDKAKEYVAHFRDRNRIFTKSNRKGGVFNRQSNRRSTRPGGLLIR